MKRLAALLIAAAALFAIATPAHAAADERLLLVSTDGVNFSTNPVLEPFHDTGRVVPGDVASTSIWVRNTATEPGRVRLDVVDVRTDDIALARAMSVSASDGVVNGGNVSLADALIPAACTPVVDEIIVAPGETVKLAASLSVSPTLGEGADGRAGVLSEVSFRMRVILTDASVDTPPATQCEFVPEAQPDDSALPNTGADFSGIALITGASALVIVGIVLLLLRRRKDQRD